MPKLPSSIKRNPELAAFWISVVFSSAADFSSAVIGKNLRESIPYCVAFLCATIFVWRFWEKIPPMLWKGTIFRGVQKPWNAEAWTSWTRQDDVRCVVETITKDKPMFHVLCGASGAGKSVLVATQVIRTLESQIPTAFIRSLVTYTPIEAKIAELKAHLDQNRGGPRFLILDQIEQLVNMDRADQEAMVSFINEILSSRVKCLAIVRDDFFYHLRFLGSLLSSPSKAIHLKGLDPSKHQVFNQVSKDFLKIADPECFEFVLRELQSLNPKADGSISPLELQIIGMMLERRFQNEHQRLTLKIYRKELRSTNELLRSYFAMYIEASPSPEVAQAILFALSTDIRLRGSLNYEQLSSVVFQDRTPIVEVLKFLLDNQLIISKADYHYEFAHDQLAAGFREYAFSEMSPEIRDNISHATERPRVSLIQRNILSNESIRNRRGVWNSVFLLLMLGTILRCFSSTWSGWYIFNGVFGEWINLHSNMYPLEGLAHLAGSLYTIRLERDLLVRVRPELCFFPWWIFPILGIILMGGTWWASSLWITAVGLMAVALGIHRLAIKWRIYLPKQAERRLSRPGVLTAASGVFVVIMGLIYALIFMPRAEETQAIFCTLIIMIGAFISVGWGIRQHLAPQALEAVLGTIDRANTQYYSHDAD